MGSPLRSSVKYPPIGVGRGGTISCPCPFFQLSPKERVCGFLSKPPCPPAEMVSPLATAVGKETAGRWAPMQAKRTKSPRHSSILGEQPQRTAVCRSCLRYLIDQKNWLEGMSQHVSTLGNPVGRLRSAVCLPRDDPRPENWVHEMSQALGGPNRPSMCPFLCCGLGRLGLAFRL